MKKTSYLIIVALLAFCIGCKKDSKPVYTGIGAKKENLEWKAETANTFTGYKPAGKKDTLIIVGRSGEENIIIVLAQKGKGTYTGDEIRAYYYQTVGFDVLTGSYQLANTPANKVIITEYDEPNRVLKGVFNFVFKKAHGSNVPDTLRFTDGQINMQLTDQFIKVFTGFPPRGE